MSRGWVEALLDADLGSALLFRSHLLDLPAETLQRTGLAAVVRAEAAVAGAGPSAPRGGRNGGGGGMDDEAIGMVPGLTLRLPDLSPPTSRVPSTSSSSSLGQTGPPEGGSPPAGLSPFRRAAFSRPLLQGQEPTAPGPGHGLLPDVMPVELRHGLGRRPDLHAELDLGLLSEALPRRASRERLIRRQLLGQRIDRNRSLQEVASLDDTRGGLANATAAVSMSLSATRLPEIHTLHDSSSARSLLSKKASSESQEAKAKDDQQAHDAGDEADDDVQSALMALLECPVCRDFLQPPLKQCSNGHVVCFACWPRLALCPACRAPFIPTASLTLDGILRTLRFPCPNKDHGCGLSLRMDARLAHDQVCPFRPRGCPLARCEWQGPADALAPHCREAHSPLQVDRHAVVSVPFQVERGASSLDGVPTIVHHEQRVFSLAGAKPGEGQIFLFQSRYDLWRSKFFAEMLHVAGEPQDSKHAWEVELRSADVQLCLRRPVATVASAACGTATPPGLNLGLLTTPPSPGQAPINPTMGLKLDLDVFNQFMEGGKYTLRIALH